MTSDPGILVISLLLIFIVSCIDNEGEKAGPESKLKIIDEYIFTEYYRRMVIYFLSMLSLPIGIILITLTDFGNYPLLYLGLYTITFLMILGFSIFYGGNRVRKQKRIESSMLKETQRN